MKLGKLLFAGLLAVVVLPGCGSSDDEKSVPQLKCEDLLSTFCNSGVNCEVSGGLIDASEREDELSSCMTGVKEVVNCSRAQSITSNYDACMNKLRNPPCEEVNKAIQDGTLALPTECNGVILIQQ